MNRRHTGLVPAVLAVALVFLTACGGTAAEAENTSASLEGAERALYEAALKEGTVRWYTSHTEEGMEAAIAAFEEKYPDVDVEGLRLADGNLITRYSQETEADSRSADVVAIGDERFLDDGFESGWFAEYSRDELPALAEVDDRWVQDGRATVHLTSYGICYNTETVDTPPAGWEDVLENGQDGRIVFPDFRNVSAYVFAGQIWSDHLGEGYLEYLSGLHPIKSDSMVPGLQSVANGQADYALVCPPVTAMPLKAAGAPIDVVLPDPVVAMPHEAVISEASASPHGARLLVNFLMTEEGQQAFGQGGVASTVDAEGAVPLTDDFAYPDFSRYEKTYELMERYF